MMAVIYNWLGLYIDWHCCQIDHNQLRLCVDEYIVKSIAISLDCVSMDINGGYDGVFDGWFYDGFYIRFDVLCPIYGV